jgi:hypothetical protein
MASVGGLGRKAHRIIAANCGSLVNTDVIESLKLEY